MPPKKQRVRKSIPKHRASSVKAHHDTQSRALQSFLDEVQSISKFFIFFYKGVAASIEISAMVDDADIGWARVRDFVKAWETLVNQHTSKLKYLPDEDQVKKVYRRCYEMTLSRIADAFQLYITNNLRDVFLRRPEVLRSSETVTVLEVLSCNEMSEVVRLLAERKVDSLSYQGFDELLKYLQERIGLNIQCDDSLLATVRQTIEVRNIIVHHGGRVSSLFLKRTKRRDLVQGHEFPLTDEYIIESIDAIRIVAKALDAAFIRHFGPNF
jgi:hypothetical protein